MYISQLSLNSEREFWLGVWCDVNTTVSTLSLSRRRHSACHGFSLFLPRSSPRALSPLSSLSPSSARPARAFLLLAPELPTLFRVGHTGEYPVDSTHLHPHTPAMVRRAGKVTHTHATCTCARWCVRHQILGPRKFSPSALPPLCTRPSVGI